MTTIAMPNGARYRISSVRRYIVVCNQADVWRAIKRTDNLQTALMAWRRTARAKAITHVIDAKAEGGPVVIR
jgi:hypothetical protein